MGFFKKLFDKDKKFILFLPVVLCAGITLLLLNTFWTEPSQEGKTDNAPAFSELKQESSAVADTLQEKMEEILSLVENAGQVKVLINYGQGAETIVAENTTRDESLTIENDSGGGTRQQSSVKSKADVVIIKQKDGSETPVVLAENPPKVEGVIIVAEGGGDIFVKDALIRAASGLLGVPVHKVTVLKMKS